MIRSRSRRLPLSARITGLTTIAARRSGNLKKKTILLPIFNANGCHIYLVFFVLAFFSFLSFFFFFSFWVGLRFLAPLIIRPLKRWPSSILIDHLKPHGSITAFIVHRYRIFDLFIRRFFETLRPLLVCDGLQKCWSWRNSKVISPTYQNSCIFGWIPQRKREIPLTRAFRWF